MPASLDKPVAMMAILARCPSPHIPSESRQVGPKPPTRRYQTSFIAETMMVVAFRAVERDIVFAGQSESRVGSMHYFAIAEYCHCGSRGCGAGVARMPQ